MFLSPFNEGQATDNNQLGQDETYTKPNTLSETRQCILKL